MTRAPLVTLSTAMLLVGPGPTATAEPRQECLEAQARFAIGQRYSPQLGQRAAQASGARAVREVHRGGVYTRELSPNRLNLEVDHRGIVVAVRCG